MSNKRKIPDGADSLKSRNLVHNDTKIYFNVERTPAKMYLTGEILKHTNWNGCRMVIGYDKSGTEIYLVPTRHFVGESTSTVDKVSSHYVMPPESLPGPKIEPEAYPDLIVKGKDSDRSWVRPCHRAILAKCSRKFGDLMCDIKPGAELEINDSEITEKQFDCLLGTMYFDKPIDNTIVPTQLLLNYGFFSLLEYADDLVITEENCGPLTEAIFSKNHGPMTKVRKLLQGELSK